MTPSTPIPIRKTTASHRAQASSTRSARDLPTLQDQDTNAVLQLLALAPSADRPSTVKLAPGNQPQPHPNTPSPPSRIAPTPTAVDFPAAMSAHYTAAADPISPHIFAQLCNEYNDGKCDDKAFYVRVYRLFYTTRATHLMPGFRAFLPNEWRHVELGWLEQTVEAEVIRERVEARERIGGLGRAVLGQQVGDLPSAAAAPKRRLDGDFTTAETEMVLDRPAAKRVKRVPTRGFRAPSKTTSRFAEGGAAVQDLIEEPSSNKKRTPKRPTSKPEPSADLHSSPPEDDNDNLSSPPASSPPPNAPTTTTTPSLPPASSIRHLGPIYSTKRHILSRADKPYIHALCGQQFGNPAEVARHHNGQGGRPGCWEKSGKPVGKEGEWDRDPSCKVKVTDLVVVKVREGWVVTGWGRWGWLGRGVDGVVSEAVAVAGGGVEEGSGGGEDDEDDDESEGEDEGVDEVEADHSSVADAAVRAAALGLRARK